MKTISKLSPIFAFVLLLNWAQAQDVRKLDYFDAISDAGDVHLIPYPR